MNVLDLHPRQRPDVAARVIEGEAVLVSPGDALVHELDQVATFVWERCDGTRTGHALVAELLQAFEVGEAQAQTDVAALLRELEGKGLVVLEGTAG